MKSTTNPTQHENLAIQFENFFLISPTMLDKMFDGDQKSSNFYSKFWSNANHFIQHHKNGMLDEIFGCFAPAQKVENISKKEKHFVFLFCLYFLLSLLIGTFLYFVWIIWFKRFSLDCQNTFKDRKKKKIYHFENKTDKSRCL